MSNQDGKLKKAAELIFRSSRTVAFTGAGISVESGIPPFRGKDGLWSKYDPVCLDIDQFNHNPNESWPLIKEIFYDFFGAARPNEAHYSLHSLEQAGYLHSIITQNIDNLHQEAGSTAVYEFHGNSRELVCRSCLKHYNTKDIFLANLPPRCPVCGSVLKPNFVFFGEPIPEPVNANSFREALLADVFIIIGTTGEIMPASLIPYEAKKNDKKIIEINVAPSNYTPTITDIFLEGKAATIVPKLAKAVMIIAQSIHKLD
ncbi:MAG: NAD-dependent deacylase [Lentisphaerae bacterium]|nr:NAD-dependent deacylase [Lentisphaerota bacterium]